MRSSLSWWRLLPRLQFAWPSAIETRLVGEGFARKKLHHKLRTAEEEEVSSGPAQLAGPFMDQGPLSLRLTKRGFITAITFSCLTRGL